MTRRKQTTAVVLAGAIALASGAYALGAQAGDGSADAAKTARDEVRFGHGFGRGVPGLRPGFESLADRLGVDEDELRTALEDIATERKDDSAQRLADALGVNAAKVEQAFESVRPERRPDRPRLRRPEAFAAALAKKLGLSTAKVRAAIEKRRDRDPSELADELGVSEERLHEAFHAVFRDIRPPHRPGLANLAKELGVTQAQLEAAFEKLRDQKDALRDEFAQELADRLNLDVAKVKEALETTPRFFGRPPGP